MSVIERWWHVNDGAGDAQAVYWTPNEHAATVARDDGATVVEYVPADQLAGAVDLLREARTWVAHGEADSPPEASDAARELLARIDAALGER